MISTQHEKQPLKLGYYVVAFIDLLGQRELLRNLNNAPFATANEDRENIIENLKNTYGVVTALRDHISSYFNGFAQSENEYPDLTPELKAQFDLLTNNEIKLQTFSDTVIAYMPLANDSNSVIPERGIMGMLGAIASSAVCFMASKHPIRGGIELGVGMNITKNEIYGPVLSSAYSLESKVAQYPRFVIGNQLHSFLKQQKEIQPTNLNATVSQLMATRCLDCLTEDSDGCLTLDYLNEYFVSLFRDSYEINIFEKAFQNVKEFKSHFKKKENAKLIERFTKLLGYYNSRYKNWK